MRRFSPSKSLIQIIIWLLSAMVIAVLWCLVYFLDSLDTLASQQSNERIRFAQRIETQHAMNLLDEYSFWDIGYEKIILERDLGWIEGNSGDYLLDKSGYDFSVAMNDQEEVYLTTTENTKHLTFEQLKPLLLNMEEGSSDMLSVEKVTRGVYRLGSDIYHIVGGPFISEVTEEPYFGTYLAIGKRIDNAYLLNLADNYQLLDLKVGFQDFRTDYQIVMRTALGLPSAYLAWEPDHPSEEVIPSITIAIVVFTLVVMMVMGAIIKREQITREEYEDKLFYEATTDELTCLYNRRYFLSLGTKELDICKRISGRQFSVLMLDIDHFKQINDRYGHAVGDQTLNHFAQLCQAAIRDADILGRVGGEEFAVILPNTDTDNAKMVANRIRKHVERSPCFTKDDVVEITVSIGVASLNGNESLKSVLENADKALYEAKETGRNKVSVYTEEETSDC